MLEINKLLPESLEKLISNLNKLPGIGSKTAQRLALSILKKKHSLQNQQLRMKQNSELKMLRKKHSENLQSLYGRTMN